MHPILAVENLQISCRGRPIVRHASFSIPKGTVTAIVGPSGAGKTTLLRSINRLLDEDRNFEVNGSFFLNQERYGTAINNYDLRRKIGLVFQKPTIFPTTIFKNVIFGVRHTDPRSKKCYPPLVEQCLKNAFLWDEVKDRMHESALQLSVGQQQRLAIARALAIGPEILLMDEPTSSLDPHAAAQIEKLIINLKATTAVVVVTHNVQQARDISDQVVILRPSEHGSVVDFIVDRVELATGRWGHEC